MNRTFINLSGIGVFVLSVALPFSALAATPTPASGSSGQGLEISPPVVQLTADPGTTVTTQIRLRDITSGQLVAKSEFDDFGAQGETGQPKIFTGNSEPNTRFSLKSWIQPLGDITLNPQELRTINIKISVPKNAEPGGHYGVVRFSALPPGVNGTGVSLSASIGTLILLRVSGNITEKLNLLETFASKSSHRSSFFQQGPITFSERFENTGTVHVSPVGNLVIKDTFGKKVATLKINENNGNILPDSVRRFDETWKKKALFGRYTAAATVGYGTHGQVIEGPSVGFWVIPVVPTLTIALILIILFLSLRFAIKRYNAHILAQARKR